MMPAWITLAAMIIVYGACIGGSLTRASSVYFTLACVNALMYLQFGKMTYFSVYSYGITEEFIKILLILHICRKHKLDTSSIDKEHIPLIRWFIARIGYTATIHLPLIALLLAHIGNHAYNDWHYGLINDIIIYLEMAYFIGRSKDVVSAISRRPFFSNIWNTSHNRSA